MQKKGEGGWKNGGEGWMMTKKKWRKRRGEKERNGLSRVALENADVRLLVVVPPRLTGIRNNLCRNGVRWRLLSIHHTCRFPRRIYPDTFACPL